MNQPLQLAIESAIKAATGDGAEIDNVQTVGGGCINSAQSIRLTDGRTFFVKSNAGVGEVFFECEAAGLLALKATGTIRVPEVIATGCADCERFLILEQIETGRPARGFMARFGVQLARLHEAELNRTDSRAGQFGFAHDNFIGSSPQKNSWSTDWVGFWSEPRLGYQLKLVRDNGLGNSQLFSLGEKLAGRLDSLIGRPEISRPSLIHGDLWSGNFLCDSSGDPVLIDPAVYIADAEAELGMTTLFGGFDEQFYAAYHEIRPQREGSGVRITIYRLYHLLNHLNLFGNSYLDGCLEVLKRLT